MSQLPDKQCQVCKKMLKPVEQYSFPEVLCWTCWQDLQEVERDQEQGTNQMLTQADLIMVLRMEREGTL